MHKIHAKVKYWWSGGPKPAPTIVDNVREFTMLVNHANELSRVITNQYGEKKTELEHARMIVEKSMKPSDPTIN